MLVNIGKEWMLGWERDGCWDGKEMDVGIGIGIVDEMGIRINVGMETGIGVGMGTGMDIGLGIWMDVGINCIIIWKDFRMGTGLEKHE